MSREEPITFSNPRSQRLAGVLHHPAGKAKAAVILCHGMQSSKESEKLVMLGREFSERGILALRFDFACSGESEGKPEEVTYSGEAEDLRAAYDLVAARGAKKIGIVGSSMGGTAAALFAAGEKNLAALATIAAPAFPARIKERFLTPEAAREWREEGFIFYNGQRLNISLLDDAERLDVLQAARKIAAPALVIHGDADGTVPVEEGRALYAALAGPKRLCILEGADHRLTGVHLKKAVEESTHWLADRLQ